MRSLVMIDVATGMMLSFLALSLIASAVLETLEGWFKARSRLLHRAICQMLGDERLVSDFFAHPQIRALYRGTYEEALKRRELPSYIPSHNFALALLDIAESVAFCAFDLSDKDHTQARALVEKWFDTSMVRVSGWYKRHTGKLLLVVGFVLAAVVNVDAIHVARDLYRGLGLSIGWPDEAWPTHWFAHIVGWVFTALAISLGAPFWFDALGRVTKIRSTIKPSDDPPAAPAAVVPVWAPEPPRELPQPPSELPQPEPPIELPHEWAVGWPKRGIL